MELETMKILVCGGVDFKDHKLLDKTLNEHKPTEIIQGGAPGTDTLARLWAKVNNIPSTTFYARWDLYDKAAGPIRNQLMIDEGKPDLIIAFPGNKGTADMIAKAEKAGIKVIKVP